VKDLLSDDARPVLDEVARDRMLLVFDFDGTLAPMVEDPASAQMRDSTRALLRLVALFHPCSVVSGRARSDLLPRLERLPLMAVVGNRGAEEGYGPVDGSVRDSVAAWKAAAAAQLRDVEGIEIEDKGLSIAIHYRRAPANEAARRAILTATATMEGARVSEGCAVVNVAPAGGHDKGVAVARLAARVGRRRALYIGDDSTDEDAFRSEAVAVAVRVGRTRSSAARYYVSSQSEVDELLRALVRARRKEDGLDDRTEALERVLRW
jgi:trehalose 6-phosphate phosphatase